MISVTPAPVFPKINLKYKLAVGFLLLFICGALGAPWLSLPFSPNEIDLEHVYQRPWQWDQYEPGKPFHWLGTDQLGRDLLANIIYGARTALFISFPAMSLAVVLGIYLGSMAGYYGDKGFKKSVSTILAAFLATLFFLFYFFLVDISFLTQGNLWQGIIYKSVIFCLTFLLFKIFAWIFDLIPFLRKNVSFPLDVLVLKLIELIQSVPRLLLILSLATFVNPSLAVVIGLSAFTYWPAIARLVRSEMFKIKELPYLEAARALGFSDKQIILKHALPNALTPIIVAFAFGISNLMALESTLSFLGIGIPPDVPSWGRAITGIRNNPSAWWLGLFPGLVLCGVVLSVQTVAQLIIRLINPR